jgi:hypothetical protein
MRIIRYLYCLSFAAGLWLSACSPLSAAPFICQHQIGTAVDKSSGDPMNRECEQIAAHARDSIFHSFMDSIGTRIEELNVVAHRVDSLAKIFHDKGRVQMHLDGKSFGPLILPSVRIPGTNFRETELQVPDRDTPEIQVPEIVVPPIDIEESMSEAGIKGEIHSSVGRPAAIEGAYSGSSNGIKDPLTGNEYYMKIVVPTLRAVHVSGDAYLVSPKK